jgi:hypothetical protein
VIVESHAAVMVLAAAIFVALLLGGLAILRRQESVAVRAILFVLFSYACVWVTMWVARRGRLLVGEVAAAWIVALLLVAVVEALRFWRRSRLLRS